MINFQEKNDGFGEDGLDTTASLKDSRWFALPNEDVDSDIDYSSRIRALEAAQRNKVWTLRKAAFHFADTIREYNDENRFPLLDDWKMCYLPKGSSTYVTPFTVEIELM